MPKVKKRNESNQVFDYILLCQLQVKLIQVAGALEKGELSQEAVSKELMELVMMIDERMPMVDFKA